jgi:hypothetical protein
MATSTLEQDDDAVEERRRRTLSASAEEATFDRSSWCTHVIVIVRRIAVKRGTRNALHSCSQRV